jgi:hypothetical protein
MKETTDMSAGPICARVGGGDGTPQGQRADEQSERKREKERESEKKREKETERDRKREKERERKICIYQ